MPNALLLLTGHGFTSAATGAGIGASALTANRKAHAVATAAHATDVLQALEGHALLTAQVTLDREAFSGTTQLLHVAVLKVLDAGVGVDSGLGEDGAGPGGSDSVDVGCLLYTSPSPRDRQKSRMPSSA